MQNAMAGTLHSQSPSIFGVANKRQTYQRGDTSNLQKQAIMLLKLHASLSCRDVLSLELFTDSHRA